MRKINTVEEAYQAIGQELLAFIGPRQWDSAVGMYQIYKKEVSTKWCLTSDGQENRKGDFPPFEIASLASDAALFLRDDLLKTTGDRIWGLTFTLFPTGKFRIEYDYNKPEGYEETDETVNLSDAVVSLQNTLAGDDKSKG